MRVRLASRGFVAWAAVAAVALTAACDDGEADDPCAEETCSGHGSCAVRDGEAVCVCDPNFAGADCGECAPGRGGALCDDCSAGLQDSDGDGVCLPDCATAGLDCGAHGSCSDASGTARCVCTDNHAGTRCELCEAGYQDNDEDGECRPTCATAGLACGVRQHCSDASGTARCVDGCAEGYAGPTCSDCADGYQDNDEDGSCLPDCTTAGLACPPNSACDDASGVVDCACDDGYQDNDGDGSCAAGCELSGLTCAASEVCDESTGAPTCVCAPGYQDHDGDGTCMPDCGAAALACSGNGTCDDSTGLAVCRCEDGYARSDCGVCASPYYQDNDEDGVCEVTCYFAGDDFPCPELHECSDRSGTLECVCEAGYQDNDEDGTCLPTCRTATTDETEPLECPSPHGECTDEDGTATCRCVEGHADDPEEEGEDCLGCAEGYQDNDEDGTCLPACETAVAAGLDCAALGCDDSSGRAFCNCAEGEQDNDGDGVCRPDCEAAALGCDAEGHWLCDDASGTAACVCEEGYYADGMGACVEIGTGVGDTCETALELDLRDGTYYGDVTGMDLDYDFSCRWFPVPLTDVVYHFALEPGETRRVRFSMLLWDSTESTAIFSALLLREGADCETAEEVDCAFGLRHDYYFQHSVIEAELDGGTDGQDYYLVAGFYDYFGEGVTGFILEVENLCEPGFLYSEAAGDCVANPCLPDNPCTDANRSACMPDLSDPTPAHSCGCDLGFLEDAAGDCVPNPTADGEGCADVLPVPVVTGTGSMTGSTLGAEDDGEGSCSGDRPAPDRVYGFTLTERTRVTLELECDIEYDCMFHLRRVCDDPSTEVLCQDTGALGDTERAAGTLEPGVYYLFIDGWDSREDPLLAAGDYTMTYSFYPDPCVDEETACPGEPVCRGAGDWSSFECVCEAEGTLPLGTACVADPCLGDPCAEEPNTHCVPDLAAGAPTCVCDPTWIDDGAGGCMLSPDAEWTIIAYWALDNNLSPQTQGELDELMDVPWDENVRMVILADFFDRSFIAEVLPGRMKILEELDPDPNTGDWHQLRDFGAWAVESYPARHYMLHVSGHGGAWRSPGPERRHLLSDDDTGDIIYVTNGDWAAALAGITAAAGRRLDLIVHDNCLQGEFEMAEANEPYAEYMIASPSSHYGYAESSDIMWPVWMTMLVEDHASMTVREIAESFIDHYRAPATAQHTTIAAYDLSTMGPLEAALSDFADALVANRSESFYALVDDVRWAAQSYDYWEVVDLWDFARLMAAHEDTPADVVAAAGLLIERLGETIVYSWANPRTTGLGYSLAGSTGMSIYLPSAYYEMQWRYTDFGAVWSRNTTWDEFLATFNRGLPYRDCGAAGTPEIGYMGAEPTATLDVARSWGAPGRFVIQSFRAPTRELRSIRVAVRKTEADAHEHTGFFFGVFRPGHGYIDEARVRIGPNDGEIQYLCIDLMGIRVEVGEELQLVLGGGRPEWHYDRYDGAPFATPISYLVDYAASADDPPPFPDGEVLVSLDGRGEIPVGEYNGDGIPGSLWFEVY